MSTPEPTGARALGSGTNRDCGLRLSAALVTAGAAIAWLNDSGLDVKGHSVFERSGSSAAVDEVSDARHQRR
jgi:hypothetical protein